VQFKSSFDKYLDCFNNIQLIPMIRKLVLLASITVISFTVFSQEFISTHQNQVDNLGRKQGTWMVFDKNGDLKYEGAFRDGVPIGEFKYYYPEGETKALVQHINKGKLAYTKNFYQDGTLMAEGKYVNQKKDSTWKYYGAEGYLVSEEMYNNSIKTGKWSTYYPNGQAADETNYADDHKNGEWVQYFSDGNLKTKGSYVNDELQGLMTIYYLDGNVQVSGTYNNSMKDGIWMYFNDIGEKVRKEIWNAGVMDSVEEFGAGNE